MARATGTFSVSVSVSAWDEDTYAELDGGGRLTKARMTFGFSGDLAPGGPGGTFTLEYELG